MTELRVLFPIWSIRPMSWYRHAPLLESVARYVDLEILVSSAVELPVIDWASFVMVSPYPDVRRIPQVLQYCRDVLMKAKDFDVLYCFSSGPLVELLCAILATMAKKPAVMHINGDGSHARGFFYQPFEAFAQDALDIIALNQMDALVPINSRYRDRMKAKIKDPRRVLEPQPTSVNLKHFHPSPHPLKVTPGYGGRISPEKGANFLHKVMEANLGLEFVLAGPVNKILKEWVFPRNTHYMGVLHYERMADFYQEVSVILLPSHGEGIPGNILEAYACGRPVIVSPEATPPELKVIGWELPHDVDAWTELLSSLTPEILHEKGVEARRYIETWPTWDDYGRGMLKTFQEVAR
ncbi:MAG: glycosyltransferase [Gammaproteobacteria bacterium]|nr:glycosyltransferase [Gammaproteobacteria bacterium]